MDSHLFAGYEVPPFYDSLLGKLVVWGRDRDSAIDRARAALDELVVDGLVTNIPIHRALLRNEVFLDGRSRRTCSIASAAPRSWPPPSGGEHRGNPIRPTLDWMQACMDRPQGCGREPSDLADRDRQNRTRPSWSRP